MMLINNYLSEELLQIFQQKYDHGRERIGSFSTQAKIEGTKGESDNRKERAPRLSDFRIATTSRNDVEASLSLQ